jgi:hypothetical protein
MTSAPNLLDSSKGWMDRGHSKNQSADSIKNVDKLNELYRLSEQMRK